MNVTSEYWALIGAIVVVPLMATLLSVWCGWGIARVALPPSLQPHTRTLTPLIGLAVLMVLLYLAVSSVFGVATALPIVLVLTGALNVAVWRRLGAPDWRHLRPNWMLVALLIGTYIVGILPLIRYGHIGIIGAGWDVESSLGTARYLLRGPVSAIASAPDNPLRDLVQDPPAIGMTLGFAVVQAAVDAALNGEAVRSFAPMLSWFRTMGILAFVVWLHTTMGLKQPAALIGGVLASAGALLLWVSYFNFNNQLAGWPLLWVSLIIPLAAITDITQSGWRRWTALFLGAITVMAQGVAYYAALTLWAPLAVAAGGVLLIQAYVMHREAVGQLLRSATLFAAMCVIVALPLIRDYFAGFSFRYRDQVTSLGVFRFIGLDEIMGISAFAPDLAANPPIWSLPTLLIIAGFVIAALVVAQPSATTRWSRAPWIACAGATVTYMVWLQVGQAYPYAFMKGSAYAFALVVALIAAGWSTLHQRLSGYGHWFINAAIGAVVAALCYGQYHVITRHTSEPGLYGDNIPALLALRTQVPADATVLLTSDARLHGPTIGIAAYALDHAVVRGSFRTAYRTYLRPAEGELPEYALLHAQEDPRAWGYQERIWRGGSFGLYRRDATMRGFTPDGQLIDAGTHVRLPLKPPAGATHVVLHLALLAPGTVIINDTAYACEAGLHIIPLADVPVALTIGAPDTSAVIVRGVAYHDGQTQIAPRHQANTVVTQIRSNVRDLVVETEAQVVLDQIGPVQIALDIWDTARGVQYGWYGAVLPPNQTGTLRMTLDLASGTMNGSMDGTTLPLGSSFAGLRSGSYMARLQVGAGATLFATPIPLFQFVVDRENRIGEVRSYQMQTVVATPAHIITSPIAQFADDTALFALIPDQLRTPPGQVLNLLLTWRALRDGTDERSVLVHLLDAQGNRVAQFDGPPGAGMTPTRAWRAGDIILDARQLTLPTDIAPGSYTLMVGMYRWPSLEAVPLTVDGILDASSTLHIPVVVADE